MSVFVLKKKFIKIFAICIFSFAVVLSAVFGVTLTDRPVMKKIIVIDAGHGGIDGGASGKTTGISESELNLKFAKKLESLCSEFGFIPILTRENMDGLYDETAQSKKKSEMKNREEKIKNANPDLVLSIHMNSFSSSSTRGAHIFYAKGNEGGKALATAVADSLSTTIEYVHKTPKVGDYYILNCTDKPAILVECGFLSNEQEELLLQDDEYVGKFCYYLLCGVLKFYAYQNKSN